MSRLAPGHYSISPSSPFRSLLRAGVIRLGLISLSLLWSASLVGCDPADPLEAARAQQAEGDFASTLEPLRELLRTQPKDPETNYLYGRALVATHSPELALYSLREAMEDPLWLSRAGIQLGYAGLASDDFNEVVNTMTRVLEAEPDNIDALLLRAQAHAHWKMDPVLGLEDAETVLEIDPDRLEAYEPLILAHLALEQFTEANEALVEVGERLVESDSPEGIRAWHCSTSAVFAADDHSDSKAAETIWADCLSRYPANAVVVDQGIRFYDGQKNYARSLDIARAAHEAAPASRLYRINLATRLLLYAGKLDEAEEILLDATRAENPMLAANAWSDLGELRHTAGLFELAAEAFGHATELTDPADPQRSFRFADALILAGELDRALEQGQHLTVEAHQRLIRARVAQERGDNEAALENFSRASQLWPDNPWARYYAGRSAETLGLWDRALEEYRYSIRISAGGTDARTRAARLLASQGQLLPAYHLLFLQVEEYPLDREGMILAAYVVARASNASQLQDLLQKHLARDPASYPAALIRAAEGLAENGQTMAAYHLLRGAPGIDFSAEANSDLLAAFIRFAHEAESSEAAASAVAAVLKAAPDSARAHAARGLNLELAQSSASNIRAAFIQATNLDPQNRIALEGLGRSSRRDNPEQALKWFERAHAVAPEAEGPALLVAQMLVRLGRLDDAADRLDALIESNSQSAEVFAERIDLDLARETTTSRTLDLARLGIRLGRNASNYERLGRVLAALGHVERAQSAAETAQKLRLTDSDSP